jgi:putative transposase
VKVPSAGQNRRVPVFGALDASTGEVSAMITSRKRSAEFLDFLLWLLDDIYADREHVYLFLDNCSIHHTQAVQAFLEDNRDRLTMIWNATYAPNLNLIERFWGHLKCSAIHNYYFETVENLEDAILKAVNALNRNKNHPFRLHLQTVQSLLKAA